MTTSMRLIYPTTARLPTPMAHGLQIVENCDAFAAAGADVTLVAARRRRVGDDVDVDPRVHYGLAASFAFRRLACLDLTGRDVGWPFRVTSLSFALALSHWIRTRAETAVVYSRDPMVLAVLARTIPPERLVYEAHQMAVSPRGRRLHARAVGDAGLVIAMTSPLDDYVRALGARRSMVVANGVRAARFAALPGRAEARRTLGLPADAYLVGYVGRLQTLGVSKGVDVVVDAAARLRDVPVTLVVVGGPVDMVEAIRARWLAHGLPGERFVSPGQVAPALVPAWLAALDVGTMTFPFSPHFAECASPLKLFEYLAAGLPIIASRLPSLAEILRDGETARFVDVSDVGDTARAIEELYVDPARRHHMAAAARAACQAHLLSTRARRVLDAIAEMREGAR